jgi:hypothetical protein
MSYKSLCEYNAYDSGRQRFRDRDTKESIIWEYPLAFYDDFIGSSLVVPAAGSAESGANWVKKITGAAPPTLAGVADGVNGLVKSTLTSASQAQDAAMYMNDELMFSIAQGAIVEMRVVVDVAPTGNAVLSFGLQGAYAAGGSNFRAGFEVIATNLLALCEVDDNATDTSASSGVTLVVGTYNIFRIDATTQTDIKFFIDDVPVATSTTFASAASAANSKMQPYFGLYKASGTGVGTATIDYVKVWQERS